MAFLLSCYRILILSTVILLSVSSTQAQTSLTDIPKAFETIEARPLLLHVKNKSIKIPPGGHLQGIQSLSDSTVIITASSGSFSYYITAQLNPVKSSGQVNKLQKITHSPFRHAGGCQLNEDKLVVGVEDNMAKDKSEIIVISFDSSSNEISKQVIVHRKGFIKRSTAGAVGFTKTKTGQYLVAVGDWDSRNIDFYISRPGSDILFDSLTTFYAPDNQKWCSYQSINLMADTTGNIYLVGFGLDGLKNRADLFKVDLSNNGASLKLINSRNFNCKGGAGFRYGAGIGTTKNGSLVIYSCGRNVGKNLAVNIFGAHP